MMNGGSDMVRKKRMKEQHLFKRAMIYSSLFVLGQQVMLLKIACIP